MTKSLTTKIHPGGASIFANLAETWERRDLILSLVRRDLAVRYKQSLLGISWALIQPVTMMLIFTAIFGKIARVGTDGVPYPLQVFSGLLVWQLFASALTRGSTCLVTSSSLITKVYFPRLIIPISTLLVPLVDFAISLIFFILLLLWYGHTPKLEFLLLPFPVFLTYLVVTGLSLWLTSLHVRYRDIQLLIPLLLQIGMYATPIVYSTNSIPISWRSYYQLNPMVYIIESVRMASLGSASSMVLDAGHLIYATIVSFSIFCFGLWYFNKSDKSFTDEV